MPKCSYCDELCTPIKSTLPEAACKKCVDFLGGNEILDFKSFQKQLFQEADTKKKDIERKKLEREEYVLDKNFVIAARLPVFIKKIKELLDKEQEKRDKELMNRQRLYNLSTFYISIPPIFSFFEEYIDNNICVCQKRYTVTDICYSNIHITHSNYIYVCMNPVCDAYTKCIMCVPKVSYNKDSTYRHPRLPANDLKDMLTLIQLDCFWYIVWRDERIYTFTPPDGLFPQPNKDRLNKEKIFMLWALHYKLGIPKDSVYEIFVHIGKRAWILHC